jgi:NAD(P)H-flavin reductase
VLRELFEDPNDATRVALLYANKAPGDIWLKSELDALAARYPDRFHVRYVLEQPPADGWHGSTGRVTLDMLAQHLLPSGPGSLALLCGPPPFLEHAVLPGLKELGFQAGGAGERDDIVVF